MQDGLLSFIDILSITNQLWENKCDLNSVKKKSDFNFVIMNSRISDTELTAVLLAYVPTGFITWLITPFSYISIISLQRNTVILLENGKEYDSQHINISLVLEVIKLSKTAMQSFMPSFSFFCFSSGACITTEETSSSFLFLSSQASSVVVAPQSLLWRSRRW